jgi:hypothetical protein
MVRTGVWKHRGRYDERGVAHEDVVDPAVRSPSGPGGTFDRVVKPVEQDSKRRPPAVEVTDEQRRAGQGCDVARQCAHLARRALFEVAEVDADDAQWGPTAGVERYDDRLSSRWIAVKEGEIDRLGVENRKTAK